MCSVVVADPAAATVRTRALARKGVEESSQSDVVPDYRARSKKGLLKRWGNRKPLLSGSSIDPGFDSPPEQEDGAESRGQREVVKSDIKS